MDTDTAIDWLPILLQTSDPLFPTGAYAHSSGLEEIVRLGLVANESDLLDFVRRQSIPLLQNLELPYVRYAYEAAKNEDMEALHGLSSEISAWKICREAREASIQLGSRRLQTLQKIFTHEILKTFAKSRSPQHQIIVHGLQMAATGVPLRAALLAYFYQSLAGTCGAALKLIRIGQEAVQRVLRACLEDAPSVIAACLMVPRENAGWFNPLLEIAGMRHERAHERLFIS
jgi:urease accessory protein